MSKKLNSFRFSEDTIKMLDYLVESDNKFYEKVGCSKTNRTEKIEELIIYAFLKLKREEEEREP